MVRDDQRQSHVYKISMELDVFSIVWKKCKSPSLALSKVQKYATSKTYKLNVKAIILF